MKTIYLKQIINSISMVLIFCFGLTSGWGQESLLSWSSASQSNYGNNPWVTTSPEGIELVQGITRGSGVLTTGSAAGSAWGGSGGWSTDTSDAGSVTLIMKVEEGYVLSLSSITAKTRRSGAGPSTNKVYYAIGEGSYQEIGQWSNTSTSGNNGAPQNTNVSEVGDLQNIPGGTFVKIRIAGFSVASGNWYLNGGQGAFVINGTLEQGNVTPKVATPSISATGTANGTDAFWNSAEVSIATATENATIYYTLDGSEPTESSLVYTAPFIITETTTVKTFATAADLDDSNVATKTFTISTPASASIPYSESFNNTLGDWTNFKESGNTGFIGWTTNANGATINGYNQGNAQAWLISPKFTSGINGVLLSLDYESQYTGNDLEIIISNNYDGFSDPMMFTWTSLTALLEDSSNSTVSSSLDNFLISTNGQFHIAFVYSDNTSWARWNISNLSIENASVEVPSVTPDDISAEVGVELNYQIVAVNAPTSYSITFGNLPAGLELSETSGMISGIPTQAGYYEFEVVVSNLNGDSDPAEFTMTVSQGTQSIEGFTDLTKFDNAEDFDLPSVTNAGLTISYSSSDENVATIVGNTISIVGIGEATITATQAGDENWNAFSQEITLTVTEAPVVPKIIISQVYEGASNNKWIEITNVGATTVDLSEIQVGLWNVSGSNGEGNISNSPSFITTLSGTLASGASYLIKNSSASATVPHNPMPAASFTGSTNVANFNGNDALALLDLDENIIDAFGHGINNVDKSYHRVATVLTPNATFTTSEWVVKTLAEVAAATPTMSEYIGTHIFGASSNVVWTTENEWSNVDGPTISDDVIIEGELELSENMSAKSITVAEEGSITILSNASLTVAGLITNNGTFVVEDNANLIQTEDFTGANIGEIQVKKVKNMKHLDYTIWSSPVAGQDLQDFSPLTLPNRIRIYNETTDAWDVTTGDFNAGRGYMFRAPNADDNPGTPYNWTGTFTGIANNGDITATFAPGIFQSFGNPYPSNVTISDFHTANDFVGTLYFWTNTYDFAGSMYQGNNWSSINRDGDTVPAHIQGNEQNGNPVSNGFISVGQGFVAETNGAISEISFDNSMRTSSNAVFFRTMSQEKHNIRLNLKSENQYINQILVTYSDNASNDFDFGIDSKVFNYNGTALYSLIDNQEESFVIQGRSLPFTQQDVVALGFKAVEAGRFSISLNSVDGLFSEGQQVLLKDNYSNTIHNLNGGDYGFVSDAGTFNNRFEVVYTESLKTVTPDLNNNWIVYAQDGQLVIATEQIELKEVTVYDMLGRVVYQSQANGNVHNISNLSANGVLIVTIVSDKNQTFTKKAAK